MHICKAALLCCLWQSVALAAVQLQPFTTQVPTKPMVRDRHTLLLASFDSATSNDADYARHEPRAQTHKTKMDVPGRFGKGVFLSQPQQGKLSKYVSFVVYDGRSNWRPERGSVSFWIKSAQGRNIWRDDSAYCIVWLNVRPHVFFEKHLGDSIIVKKTGKGENSRVSLILQPPPPWRRPAKPKFGLPCAKLDPQKWHHVFASWDLADGGAYWLAVDGKGVRHDVAPPLKKGFAKPGFKIQVGGPHTRSGGDAVAFSLDDLVITDQSVRSAATARKRRPLGWHRIDQVKLMRLEDATRRWFDLLLSLEYKGTWEPDYAWPTLQRWNPRPHCFSWIGPRESVHMGKGYGTLEITHWLMRAYRDMGDRRYLDACRRAGDFAVGVQKWMGGGWPTEAVEINPDGTFSAKGHWVSVDSMNIQEGTQLAGAGLLAKLWYATGEKRYLDAFRWSCETMLEAQNRCGSWPGFFKLKTRKPGWGPVSWLNDGATLSGFSHMVAAYHVLKDKKYWDAAIRSADWLVRVQLHTPIGSGWAQQYNEKDEPAWGRSHEPPAITDVESGGACRMLGLAYDMTGDPRYLDAIRKFAELLDNTKAYPGRSAYYDPKTARPLIGWKGKIYYKEDVLKAPPKLAQSLKLAFGYSALMSPKPNDSSRLRSKWLAPRKHGPYTYPRASMQSVLDSVAGYLDSEQLDEWLAKQHSSGAWLHESPTGQCFTTRPTPVWWHFLPTIKSARVALGELPLSCIRRWWRYWPDLHPAIDYQDTPALKARGWTRDKKTRQLLPPPRILRGALGR